MSIVTDRFIQARKQIDKLSQGEREITIALDHLRAAALLYEQGGRQPSAFNIRATVEVLRKEALS